MIAVNSAFRPVLWRTSDPDGGVHHFSRKPENVAAEVAWATEDGRATVHHGDCLDVMRTMADGSVDAVVCDPPYALTANKKGGTGAASVNLESPYGRARIGTGNGGGGFMGKAWDAALPTVDMWIEALRVAKPGAHLLAFGGTRTFHRLTCAIEDAGWEIRDCLSWLYGSGFPKSHNGAWGGTALKPAWEPVVLARKPLIGTVEANHAAHGTGALNIDGCRIGFASDDDRASAFPGGRTTSHGAGSLAGPGAAQDAERSEFAAERNSKGRWPANVALDEDAAAALDEQSGVAESGVAYEPTGARPATVANAPEEYLGRTLGYGDSGGASRFFYTAKASRSEREAGLTGERVTVQSGMGGAMPTDDDGRERDRFKVTARNTHPTVKPVDLMRWLVRLVTPIGGTVLDPFLGSGTTGVAALQEGCRFIGIEREAQYVEIAKARIAHEAAQGSLFK